MSYKTINLASYQATAQEFTRNVADLAPMESLQKFVDLLPTGAKIIDIGCGSGRDAKIFTEKEMSVLGIDFCQNLIDIAKKNAPLAKFQVMDIETAAFAPSSFDGAWACCSLLHLPKKVFPTVLKNIYSSLKEGGYLYLTLKEGKGEIIEKDLRYGDFEKFCSYYEEKELKDLVQAANFKILDFAMVHPKAEYQTPHRILRLYCQK